MFFFSFLLFDQVLNGMQVEFILDISEFVAMTSFI